MIAQHLEIDAMSSVADNWAHGGITVVAVEDRRVLRAREPGPHQGPTLSDVHREKPGLHATLKRSVLVG